VQQLLFKFGHTTRDALRQTRQRIILMTVSGIMSMVLVIVSAVARFISRQPSGILLAVSYVSMFLAAAALVYGTLHLEHLKK
jgi:preprotein translocase subunit SecF